MKPLAIVQARLSSTRLPGKVLRPILGVPMLVRQVERIRAARTLDTVVIATSTDPSDDAIVEACGRHDIACERGSLTDVLDRYYQTATKFQANDVVRLTGDCPLIDPAVIDLVVHRYLRGDCDYASNTIVPTYPDGLDTEVLSFGALERAWREAAMMSEREHVTPFVKNGQQFTRVNVTADEDLSALRWTVDEPADFELVATIYDRLYPSNPAFSTADVLALLRSEPVISKFNEGFQRDAGYAESLRRDSKIRP